MAKDKFSWKSLFVQEENNSQQSETPKEETKVVPDSKITFPTNNPAPNYSNDLVPNEILGRVIEMYEKGLDSLNKPGYDFYEFFKAVMAIDPTNAQSYIMAYTMATSMDKSVSKPGLLADGEYYLTEIAKVYSKYDEEGRNIKTSLLEKQKQEKETLTTEIKTIQNKLILLQTELEQKTKLLGNYDANNSSKLQEVDQKITANNLAKDRITQKISQVISGINKHI